MYFKRGLSYKCFFTTKDSKYARRTQSIYSDIQYFAFFLLSFVCFVVKHILTYETAPGKLKNL